jgi:hypothetical protein
MANNERVSQLIELFAADLHSEDVFLLTDMSQRESKKLEMGQLLLFIESSGSFSAYNSAFADTASFVAAGNIYGNVAVANVASQSISSSWAARAVTSSYSDLAATSSYSSFCNITSTSTDTASFLKYLGTHNGTASYAINAAAADSSTTAFNLFYNGQPNGTASWAINSITTSGTASFASRSFVSTTSSFASSSFAATSASFASSSTSSSFAVTSSYLIGAYTNPVKAWAQVTWSAGRATNALFKSFNISSMTFLNFFTNTDTWAQFGLVFTTPLTSTNYILIGTGDQPYANREPATVILHPVYANRTTTSCTMSVGTDNSAFYTSTGGTYPNTEYGFIQFQIIE